MTIIVSLYIFFRVFLPNMESLILTTACFLAQVEEGWWEGTLNGKTGMFPSNFTKELLAEAEDLTPQDDTRSTRTSQFLHHIIS